MSNLKLANEVNRKLLSLVKQEREVLAEILQMIARVDQLRLFVELGYRSLYEYLTAGLGYSEAAAQRRINGARLLREVPELLASVQNGEINLSQMDLLASAAREFEKVAVNRADLERSAVEQDKPKGTLLSEKADLQTAENRNIQMLEIEKTHTPPRLLKDEIQKQARMKKIELVKSLKGLNKKSSEVLIAQTFALKPKEHVRVHHQADESTRIEMTFTREQMELLQKARDLNSHALPFGSWDEFFLYLAKRSVEQRTASARISKKKLIAEVEETEIVDGTSNSTSAAEVKKLEVPAPKTVAQEVPATEVSSKNARIMPAIHNTNTPKSLPALRRKWLRENGHCQHVDKQTGRKCTSTWQLELDHIQPRFAQGKDTPENLRLYCRHHNQLRFNIESAKTKKISNSPNY